jgi:hypothetical protein
MANKKLLLIVFGGLGMCLVGTCLLGVLVRGTASSSRASSPSAAESSRWVDIHNLLAEYADNDVRADATFKSRYVLIDGIVSDVKRDLLNTIYITIGTGQFLEIPRCSASSARPMPRKPPNSPRARASLSAVAWTGSWGTFSSGIVSSPELLLQQT